LPVYAEVQNQGADAADARGPERPAFMGTWKLNDIIQKRALASRPRPLVFDELDHLAEFLVAQGSWRG